MVFLESHGCSLIHPETVGRKTTDTRRGPSGSTAFRDVRTPSEYLPNATQSSFLRVIVNHPSFPYPTRHGTRRTSRPPTLVPVLNVFLNVEVFLDMRRWYPVRQSTGVPPIPLFSPRDTSPYTPRVPEVRTVIPSKPVILETQG